VLDYLLVTSSKWWKGLPNDVREQLSTILKEVTEARNSESTKVNNQNKENVINAGGTVRSLTAEQRQAWVNAMKPVWKKFEKDVGVDLMNAALKAKQ